MAKWYEIFQAKAAETVKVMLYDDIGAYGKTAKDFTAELDAITAKHIDLHINSYGGEIVDGLACYNAIKNHKAKVTVHIDGLAASIASLIACAGDTVCIAKNSFVMIHNGWGMAIGDPSEMRKQAEVLDKLCNSIAQTYVDKSGKPLAEVKAAMDAETWFTASEAKEFGLVDEIEDGEEDAEAMAASALLAVAKYQKAPPALRKFAASAARSTTPIAKGKAMDPKTVKFKAGVSNSGKIRCPHCNEEINVELETPADEEQEAEDKAKLAKAREEGQAAGIQAEREYRGMFNTVVHEAKLDSTAAGEFEKQFYGRSETDLKFLASHAIGQRSKAIGEGNPGNGEGESLDAQAKADKDAADKATKRFAETPEVRRMFGLNASAGADAPDYQSALKRYVAREVAWDKDQAKNGISVTGAK